MARQFCSIKIVNRSSSNIIERHRVGGVRNCLIARRQAYSEGLGLPVVDRNTVVPTGAITRSTSLLSSLRGGNTEHELEESRCCAGCCGPMLSTPVPKGRLTDEMDSSFETVPVNSSTTMKPSVYEDARRRAGGAKTKGLAASGYLWSVEVADYSL